MKSNACGKILKPTLAFLGGTIAAIAIFMVLFKIGIISFPIALILMIVTIVGTFVGLFVVVKALLDQLMAIAKGGSADSIAENPKLQQLAARNDEIGDMVRNIQSTIGNLGSVLHTIRSATAELGETTAEFQTVFGEMSSAAGDTESAIATIVSNTVSQASNTEDMKVKIDAMSEAIDKIIQSIEALNVSADNVKKCNIQAEAIMDELVRINNDNSLAIEEVKGQTERTNHSVNQIQLATDVIRDIADQTNLLALNASIEAARAGEQGKGFAVVADEIRALADQSSTSAEQIANVVNELMKNSATSVQITEKVSSAFAVQTEKISSTQQIFNELNEEITSVTSSISQIDTEVTGLNKHKTVIETGIEELTEIASMNADSADISLNNVTALRSSVDACNEATDRVVAVSSQLTGCITEMEATGQERINRIQSRLK